MSVARPCMCFDMAESPTFAYTHTLQEAFGTPWSTYIYAIGLHIALERLKIRETIFLEDQFDIEREESPMSKVHLHSETSTRYCRLQRGKRQCLSSKIQSGCFSSEHFRNQQKFNQIQVKDSVRIAECLGDVVLHDDF